MWRHSAFVATLGHFVVGNILGRIAGPNLARGPRQPRRNGKEGYLAMIAKIEIERFSLTSSNGRDEVRLNRSISILAIIARYPSFPFRRGCRGPRAKLGPAILPRMLPTTKCPRVATDAECRHIQLAGLMARAESHRTAGFTRSG